ncbi:TRAP transporter substrate-binding protein DctP [Halobellus rufus]|uniref:TRAP transporter substrate-binding protein DctP n=1 Tax=Halobellus rufus TaxID=1448860 RepID=UPI0006789484|nr:TRAP transporter substrate-binding protein DctP [Halobellus rufus]
MTSDDRPNDGSRSARSRREVLGATSGAVLAGLTGCLGGGTAVSGGGGGGDSGTTTARWAGTQNPETSCWDYEDDSSEGADQCGLVYPVFELKRRLEERSADLELTLVDSKELCSEQSCMTKMDSRVIELGSSSVANSAKVWPENEIWSIPYLFPTHSRASIGYAFTHPTVWEEYWVPFGRKYGAIPIGFDPPGYRAHFVGVGSDPEEPMTSPADFEGLKIRTTQSEVISVAFDELGMNPTTVSFADTLQGMKSGVVDGMEIIPQYAVSAGITDVTAQATLTQWAPGLDPIWCSVDFLKGLSDGERETFASVTAELAEESVRRSDDVYESFQGLSPDAPVEGSNYQTEGPDGEPVRVNWLEEDQLAEWREPVDPATNPDLYRDAIDRVHGEFTDGFFDRVYDVARESGVPDRSADFSLDAWWDDYLERI